MNIKLFIESLSDSERSELKSYFLGQSQKRERIEDFILRNEMSTRLKKILTAYTADFVNSKWVNTRRAFLYVDEVHEVEFMVIRNAGKKSWNEFKQLTK